MQCIMMMLCTHNNSGTIPYYTIPPLECRKTSIPVIVTYLLANVVLVLFLVVFTLDAAPVFESKP